MYVMQIDKPAEPAESVDEAAHVRDLKRVRSTLVDSMRRVDSLIDLLFEAGHVSDNERQFINSQPTIFEQVGKLVDMLCKKVTGCV